MCKEQQSLKASATISSTKAGIVKLVKYQQPLKASNLGHRVWNCQTGQRAAAFKGHVFNLGHRVQNCQTGQGAAFLEGI